MTKGVRVWACLDRCSSKRTLVDYNYYDGPSGGLDGPSV
jgi:hypothetical protein